MHAAQYLGSGRIDYVETRRTEPGPGEVAVDVHYTGICGTDLHILHGAMDARVTLPAVIGHEMSGVVRAVGDGVTEWASGHRVGVMPLAWCGQCPACRAGHHHICHRLNFLGIDSPGAMQATWVVPQNVLVRLPEGLDLRAAALLEPLAVATHDVRRAALTPGEHVLVIGGGPIGTLIALLAAGQGAEVLVSEPDTSRRALLAGFDIDAVNPLEVDLAAEVLRRTDGAGAGVTFEVSGSQAGLDAALGNLATRGRMVLVAIHATPRPVDLHRIFWRELTVLGARVYEREDCEAAAATLGRDTERLASLVTAVYPLAEAAAAFARLESGGGVMKVLLDCTEAVGA